MNSEEAVASLLTSIIRSGEMMELELYQSDVQLFMSYRYGVGQVVGAPASREGTRTVAERTARVMKDSPYEEVMFGYPWKGG